ncbi:hypothetical protein AGMMS49546_28500 [Spirochaetia bacterium]|nr:hypothetical protein AGMMS49546_28500 [Spirochaetia bacterium]
MIQFYFLSIVFNAAAGFVLINEGTDVENSIESSLKFSFRNETFHLILGILTMVTGLLKLLSSTPGDIPIIGDLFPAVTGLAAGFILLFGYYQGRSVIEDDKNTRVGEIVSKNRKWIGFAALIVAALHFLFPQALLL